MHSTDELARPLLPQELSISFAHFDEYGKDRMNTVWVLTIIANLAFMIALILTKGWNRFPLTFGCQMMCCMLSAMIVCAFYSPLVNDRYLKDGWISADELCILMSIGMFWEISERSKGNLVLRTGGIALLIQTILSIWEYHDDVFLSPHDFRITANIAITFLLAIGVMVEDRKEIYYERKRRKEAYRTG